MPADIFIPCTDGFGDTIAAANAGYFVHQTGKSILGKLHTAWLRGKVGSITALGHQAYSPRAMEEVWGNLPFPVEYKPFQKFFPEMQHVNCNTLPSAAPNGALNARTSLPPEIASLQETSVPFPFLASSRLLPERFIFFTAEAGSSERILRDQDIVTAIRTATPRPIVQCGTALARNGNTLSPITTTQIRDGIDLRPIDSVREMFWIASRSVLVISAVTSLRVLAPLVGVPVIEVTEFNHPKHLDMMQSHYKGSNYSLSRLNSWFLFPNQRDAFMDKIREVVAANGGHW